jgi:hypothetical protein
MTVLDEPEECKCHPPTASQKDSILRHAAETRRFEITLFWQRSLFFWGFIAATFVAYAAATDKLHGNTELALPIACFGALSSLAWTLTNRGSKYWQEAWEKKVKTVEKEVLGKYLFSEIEPLTPDGIWGPARYSVSKLTIILSDLTGLFWLGLVIKELPLGLAPLSVPAPYLIFVGALVYAVVMLTAGRSR